ncbi:DNA-binding beta-propeller fold protein YncE [Rhodoferax ferrireducens]|uniref:DNA-binding beta-propeller fold protein YncE n=1 Tax=Rhodoferax ferrireducens TaxID=192843 RepID=A0ABU2CF09_9BURK|nr:DNA-binding beta-propeller fold protein YncE [Rhodoferax ferrireducens]
MVLANGSTTATVAADGSSFSFAPLVTGSNYNVAIQSAPSGMACSVTGGSGTLSASVTSVVVTCSTQTYTLGGSIAPASGTTSSVSGLVLANGSDTFSVPTGAATFTMPTAVPYGSSYQISVQTQPTGMGCTVSPSTAQTMPAGNLTNVVVTCADQSFALGGTIIGLGTSTGLVLANQGTDSTTISANATSFSMNTTVPHGTAYAVTVASNPAGKSCAVTNGSGTMPATNVSNVAISCTSPFSNPSGVALDASGNVYVSNAGSNTVKLITVGTRAVTTLGIGFSFPIGAAVDPSGNVYVADFNNSALKMIAAGTGTITTVGSGFSQPVGVSLDAGGNIYVADYGNGLVKMITAGTGTITTLGSGFSQPTGVVVDSSGNVYVADFGANLVKMIAAGTGTITTLGSGFNQPLGIAVDSSGNVYVADRANNAVKMIAAGTGTVTTLGSGFSQPWGVAVDASGNVYVADYGTNSVKKILQSTGAVVSLP